LILLFDATWQTTAGFFISAFFGFANAVFGASLRLFVFP
jgi:hypothetical protein